MTGEGIRDDGNDEREGWGMMGEGKEGMGDDGRGGGGDGG